MKGCSASLAIREMQIKTIVRHHFVPVRMAIINQQTPSAVEVVEKREPTPLVGMQTGTASVENSIEFPQKTKIGTAF